VHTEFGSHGRRCTRHGALQSELILLKVSAQGGRDRQQVGQSCLKKNVKTSPIDILHGIALEPHLARLVVLVVLLLWCSCGVPALSN
jgi:hypothetical protein